MQRIWDLARLDSEGRADIELRRAYLMFAKGQVPVTEAEVTELGRMPESQLRMILPWLNHRLSLSEAQARADFGETAPSILYDRAASQRAE